MFLRNHGITAEELALQHAFFIRCLELRLGVLWPLRRRRPLSRRRELRLELVTLKLSDFDRMRE